MWKTILSIIAMAIIALMLYVIWQDVGPQLEESKASGNNSQTIEPIKAQSVGDQTLAKVDIDTNTTTLSDNTKRILVLGDSLTAGYGIVLESSWLYLLEQEIRAKFDDSYRVINSGISGDTTGGGLARLPQALEQYKPEIVIIELGGNDGLRGYPVKSIRENLLKIISTVKASGAKPVLAGIQIPPNYGERYTTEFANIYPQLSQQESVPLIPFILGGVALVEEWMQQDGIHPNEDGQEQIKENVIGVLGNSLNK